MTVDFEQTSVSGHLKRGIGVVYHQDLLSRDNYLFESGASSEQLAQDGSRPVDNSFVLIDFYI